MKTITREYNLFNFDELSEEAKDKVIHDNFYFNVEHTWWEMDDIYFEIASEYGIKIKMNDVCFDLERGAFVAFDTFNHSRSDTWECPIVVEDEKKFCKKADVKFNPEAYISIGHKHYAGSLISNFIETDDYEEEDFEALQTTLEEMLDKILSQLRKEYDYLTSRESIAESIRLNEYTFLQNGEMFFE